MEHFHVARLLIIVASDILKYRAKKNIQTKAGICPAFVRRFAFACVNTTVVRGPTNAVIGFVRRPQRVHSVIRMNSQVGAMVTTRSRGIPLLVCRWSDILPFFLLAGENLTPSRQPSAWVISGCAVAPSLC